jgi:thiol-disulfide isomerase/thioredoxin
MKQTFLSLLFLLIATCGWAQKVWENPTSSCYYSDYINIKVIKVEFSEKETVLHFYRESQYGLKFMFIKETYLKTPDGKCYFITSGKAINEKETDIPLGEWCWPDSLTTKFALHFEPLPANVECFHLIEGNNPTAFRILNITEGMAADMSGLFNSNWRNDQTGDWQLGLYADNAVYDSKVWKYEEKNDKNVVLTDGQEKVTIAIGKEKAGKRKFNINGQKVTLSSFGPVLPAYPVADNTAFSTEYKDGEAVISGWIKDLPKDIHEGKISITANSANIVTGVPQNANTTSDELGRFTMTVKLNGPQTVRFIEAGKYVFFAKDIVLEPGKKYYMVHDWKNGCCLFMGENSRLQNELAANPCDIETNPFWQIHGYDKMMTEFKEKSLANYDKATSLLNDIIARNPNVSSRYRDYVNERNRIVAASEIQDLMNDKNGTLTDEFVSAINGLTVFNPTVPFSLAPGFRPYLHLRNFACERGIRQGYGQTPQMYLSLEEKGMIKYSDSEHDFLNRWQQREKLREEKQSTLRGQKLQAFKKELDEICKKSEILEFVDKENIKKVYDEFVLNRYLSNCIAIDSLSNEQIMRDYGRAVWLCRELADCRKLKDKERASVVINEIKNDYFRQQVIDLNNYYEELARQNEEAVKKVIAPSSNVEGLTDGKAIIDKIIEPYKGKIVYMDVWGTWCKPCIEDIKISPKLKESVKDYDIVYIYFHVGGDMEETQDTWKGAIAELGLAKPNYVHYLLPRPQQKMVTEYLKVEGYPSYYLFDKQGNMEKLDRGHIGNVQGFKKKIEELSKK